MIKEENKRMTITLEEKNIDRLKIIMFNLKIRQPSKAINCLIENYFKK